MDDICETLAAGCKKTGPRCKKNCLLLFGSFLLLFLSSSSFANTIVTFVSTSNTERPVGLEFTFCVCDGARCLCGVWIRNCKGSTGSSGFKVLCLIELLAKKMSSRQRQKNALMNRPFSPFRFCGGTQ